MESKKQSPEIDPDAPASEEEILESNRLREALEDPGKDHPAAELARAVALSFEPRPIDDRENRALVARALARTTKGAAAGSPRKKTGVVVRVAFGVAAALALAASVAIVLRGDKPRGAHPTQLAVTRSTQALFAKELAQAERHDTTARGGGESARIDRIALARAADLRENRFAQWGVR